MLIKLADPLITYLNSHCYFNIIEFNLIDYLFSHSDCFIHFNLFTKIARKQKKAVKNTFYKENEKIENNYVKINFYFRYHREKMTLKYLKTS